MIRCTSLNDPSIKSSESETRSGLPDCAKVTVDEDDVICAA